MNAVSDQVRENYLKFFEFCYDRQLIWYKKEVLREPRPWTTDSILDKFLFCNIYRELDRGTRYIINAVLRQPALSGKKTLFNTIAYRFFNVSGLFSNVFEGLLEPDTFVFEEQEKYLDEKIRSRKCGPLWRPAYTVTPAPYRKDYRARDKHIQVLLSLGHVSRHQHILEHALVQKNAEDMILVLKSIPLVGAFLAGQILMDMTYSDHIPFDGNDFLIVGPGASWGLAILNPEMNSYQKQYDGCKYLWENQKEYFEEVKSRTGKDWVTVHFPQANVPGPYLSLMDIQHDLCEYRKFNRLSSGKGKRRYYLSQTQSIYDNQ